MATKCNRVKIPKGVNPYVIRDLDKHHAEIKKVEAHYATKKPKPKMTGQDILISGGLFLMFTPKVVALFVAAPILLTIESLTDDSPSRGWRGFIDEMKGNR